MEKVFWSGLVCLLVGCGAAADPGAAEEVAVVDAELSQSCVNTVTDTHFSSTDYTSPRTYSEPGCYKGVVGEVYDPGRYASAMAATWADTVPTTQASCESAWLGAYLFGSNGEISFEALAFDSSQGTWSNGVCTPPKVVFSITPPALKRYRLAASARTASSTSAPTRQVRIKMPGKF